MNVTTATTSQSTVQSSITFHPGPINTAAMPARIVNASTGSARASTSTSSVSASAANTARGSVTTRGTRRHH